MRSPRCRGMFLVQVEQDGLGMTVIFALAIRRRMERTVSLNLSATESTRACWERGQTARPASLMLTKYSGIFVLISVPHRRLACPVIKLQFQYLELLDLAPDIFLHPSGRHHGVRKHESRNYPSDHQVLQNASFYAKGFGCQIGSSAPGLDSIGPVWRVHGAAPSTLSRRVSRWCVSRGLDRPNVE